MLRQLCWVALRGSRYRIRFTIITLFPVRHVPWTRGWSLPAVVPDTTTTSLSTTYIYYLYGESKLSLSLSLCHCIPGTQRAIVSILYICERQQNIIIIPFFFFYFIDFYDVQNRTYVTKNCNKFYTRKLHELRDTAYSSLNFSCSFLFLYSLVSLYV